MATRPMDLLFCLFCLLFHGGIAISTGTSDGMERWGYAQTRPKVNTFWWWYQSPQRVSLPAKPWPTILWLQGGPGGSGVGRGNFVEIGPLDVNLKSRNWTWLHKADLIFVDTPVGVGYSYVEDPSAMATTDAQAATDIVELLKVLTKELPTLKGSPLFLVGESYGGKFAAMVGVHVTRAIRAGTLKLTLGGVCLGDSWISPEDFTLSYTQLLHSVSRLPGNAVGDTSRMAEAVKEQIAAGHFAAAQKTWTDLLDLIDSKTNSVNMNNFMLDAGMNPVPASKKSGTAPNTLDGIMNGVVKSKLKIIPKNLVWKEATLEVYEALANNFMKPAINEVDELLSHGVNVTVYNGQLDVICPTIGVEAWVNKLKWSGLKKFLNLSRQPLNYCYPAIYCSKIIKAYVSSYGNLNFYWILGAGHMVPVDQPYVAFRMITTVIQAPDS
ncbi:hypothetical protein EJB05_46928 [Eragrostis curvula]|uniref:Carboxypeptidase n=1 Tax=Eragrostis curvula TaxID=38414 RepID=A0A5J9T6D4_9POAL|nr:hypothetical protein EJB05_46928 [Eragrostis curvula]